MKTQNMKNRLSFAILGSLLGLITAFPASGADTDSSDWREEYAYTLGVQAYIYAYPLIKMSNLRYDWVTNPKASFYASLNHFHNKFELSDQTNYTTGGSPNQDTLYSWGWMDLRDEPVILSHPEMGNRYFVFEMGDYFSDNFAYVGKRTTGGTAGAFAILPPGWKGELPKNIQNSFESPTTFALIFGRTMVDGPDDVLNVNKLQRQYHMTPLSVWLKGDVDGPDKRDVFKPYAPTTDPLADWRTINRAWAENPLATDADSDLVRLFKEIGIGPDFSATSIDKLAEPTRKGLARAAKAVPPMLEKMRNTGAYKSKYVNGWGYLPKTFGRSGLAGDYVTRAAIQSMAGMISNDPVEAVYLVDFLGADGKPLQGGQQYTITFDGKDLPPAKEFWSLTIYGNDSNFIPNDIKRYAIGDRTKGLTKGKDGSFTVYIQPTPPSDKAKRANWLPSSKGGKIYFCLRIYVPGKTVLNQTWVPPAVTKTK